MTDRPEGGAPDETPYLVCPVHPAVDGYIAGLHGVETPVLLEMEAHARDRGIPVVGRVGGHFLHLLALASCARRAFVLGAGFGYSAWWLARAVGAGGTVICSDPDPDNRHRARGFLERSGLWERIRFEVGVPHEMMRLVDGPFDFILNDGDKVEYPAAWLQARERLRPAGIYVAQHALWGGRVIFQEVEDDPVPGATEAIREHDRLVTGDPEFDTCVNPVRDGLLVARKRGSQDP